MPRFLTGKPECEGRHSLRGTGATVPSDPTTYGVATPDVQVAVPF